MSERYHEPGRVQQSAEFFGLRSQLSSSEVAAVRTLLRLLRSNQASYEITADQNNFRLSQVVIHRFTTDASRTITGFFANDFDNNIKVIANVGDTNDLVLADDNGGSDATNRILCHTGANITLGPNESALIFYDRTSARVRTIGF